MQFISFIQDLYNEYVVMENRSSHNQILEIDGVRLLKIKRRIRRGKRPLWSDQEVKDLIDIIKDKKLLSSLTRKKYGRYEMFHTISEELKQRGYARTIEQINTKWKQLRLSYHRAKAEMQNNGSGSSEMLLENCPFYDELEELHTGKTRVKHQQSQPIQPGTFILIDPTYLVKIDPSQLVKIDSSNRVLVQSPEAQKKETQDRIYSNAIENNAWLNKVLETTKKRWEDEQTQKERELTVLRHWEEKLLEKQCAALSKANVEFLKGLKGIVDMFKKP